MSLRKPPDASEASSAASRNNGRQSKGPVTSAGKARSSRNSFKHGLYCTPDEDAQELMESVEEDPELAERLEEELREALQPSNAMEALIVADIARLYRDKEVLENGIRKAQRIQAACRHLFPYDAKEYHSRLIPGNRHWGIALQQQARINGQIEAKLNLLMRLKKRWENEAFGEKSALLGTDATEIEAQPQEPASIAGAQTEPEAVTAEGADQ